MDKRVKALKQRVHDNCLQKTDHEQTDHKQRQSAKKGDPKYIFTIPRAILPKL